MIFALALVFVPSASGAPSKPSEPSTPQGTTIIVTPPPTESERREELREFTKQIIRPPKLRQPVAKFHYPVCVQVLGLAAPDAEAIAERIRANARAFGIGSDDKPGCIPTIKVAFMAPEAGPPMRWISADSPSIAHLASYQRDRVLAETGPVRAWNRVVVRDADGQAFRLSQNRVIGIADLFPPTTEPYSTADPIVTTEITGAAVLISRDAAHGLTLVQLADYATMRTLIGTSAPSADSTVPAPTILTLFDDTHPPEEMTSFDRSLLAELYNASRNSSAQRVYKDIARAAVERERNAKAQAGALDR